MVKQPKGWRGSKPTAPAQRRAWALAGSFLFKAQADQSQATWVGVRKGERRDGAKGALIPQLRRGQLSFCHVMVEEGVSEAFGGHRT